MAKHKLDRERCPEPQFEIVSSFNADQIKLFAKDAS